MNILIGFFANIQNHRYIQGETEVVGERSHHLFMVNLKFFAKKVQENALKSQSLNANISTHLRSENQTNL